VTFGGQTIQLMGTFDTTTGALMITGGGFTFAGTLSNGVINGDCLGPGGIMGTFTVQSNSAGTVAVYCGTYGGQANGTWNLVQGADNTMTGSYTSSEGDSGLITGTRSGNNITLSISGQGTAMGTISGSSASGTWSVSGFSGTWQGSTSCN
jgi:hypothetical protein